MLTGISVTCFLFSYLAVLVIELTRPYFQWPVRQLLTLFGMCAGLLAHTIFLTNELFGAEAHRVLENWFQWVALSAWGLAVTCTYLMARNREGNIGVFVIPMILILIGLASFLRESQPFSIVTSVSLWARLHGISLLLGTMFICLGCAFGVMYLLQSMRLKSKLTSRVKRFRLPALEFLRSMNRMNLFAASASLGIGMLSGILLNLSRDGKVAWLSSGVLMSIALFIWVSIASALEYSSKGSLGGRRSAYLSISNFVFLAIVLIIVLLASHGQSRATEANVHPRHFQFHSKTYASVFRSEQRVNIQ